MIILSVYYSKLSVHLPVITFYIFFLAVASWWSECASPSLDDVIHIGQAEVLNALV